ncbi:MAG: CHAD domain-containing protein [Leptolyngbyaceae cyanobacterium bins.302]|nr:CHAD domain-containing protein [Leptolyngbyaceae cyanobacterium bins.302]
MKKLKEKKEKGVQSISLPPSLTFGEYAYSTIEKQYRSILKQEPKVLADEDPEHLHQMRVGTRRLRTALQVFAVAIDLPESASQKRIGALARILGGLRDLDVQTADLRETYRPQLEGSEKDQLDEVIKILTKKRRQAYAEVEKTFGQSRYRELKNAYENWLESPRYTPLATLPIRTLLPDLLSPLLSELLLHPGWLVPADYSSMEDGETLHDLRKAFKHVRYQTEFFTSFYGKSFQEWVADIKLLQEKLGKLQDNQVLQQLLAEHLPRQADLPTLQSRIQQTQSDVLSDWDEVRQRYLEPEFRYQLYQMLLNPDENNKN